MSAGNTRTAEPLWVVIADNDPEVIALIRMDLELEGHRIVGTATNGEEAVAVCATQRPDVLVVDFRMPPGINGIETIQRVLEAKTAARCILYSNYRSAQIAASAARLGATYVPKGPLRTLRDALDSVVPEAHRTA